MMNSTVNEEKLMGGKIQENGFQIYSESEAFEGHFPDNAIVHILCYFFPCNRPTVNVEILNFTI